MTSYLFINNIWPEFAELFATCPHTIHEFYSSGKDCLTVWVNFKLIMLCLKSILYKCFTAV